MLVYMGGVGVRDEKILLCWHPENESRPVRGGCACGNALCCQDLGGKTSCEAAIRKKKRLSIPCDKGS
jgi:hypothetical protein